MLTMVLWSVGTTTCRQYSQNARTSSTIQHVSSHFFPAHPSPPMSSKFGQTPQGFQIQSEDIKQPKQAQTKHTAKNKHPTPRLTNQNCQAIKNIQENSRISHQGLENFPFHLPKSPDGLALPGEFAEVQILRPQPPQRRPTLHRTPRAALAAGGARTHGLGDQKKHNK